eukprot:1509979-Rhodomonas_salina.1
MADSSKSSPAEAAAGPTTSKAQKADAMQSPNSAVLHSPVVFSHLRQPPAADPVNPSSHRQCQSAVLRGADPACSGHRAHSAGPGSLLYVPASHATHGPPSGPVKPRSH